MDELIGELDQLRQDAERLLAQVSTDWPAGTVFEGADETETVTARVNAEGGIAGLAITPTWRQQHSPHGLAGAILSAVTAAHLHRIASWSWNVSERGSANPASQPRVSRSRPTETAPGPEPETLRSLADLVQHAETELEQALQAARERTAQPSTVSSRDGHVTATVSNGEVIALRLDGQWAAKAHSAQIAAEARTVFPAGPVRPLSHTQPLPALDALIFLASDPAALTRALGLRG
ncbi:hypothetical protein [Longispora albida]|uniref:hypothetical protein n=1 Tax=Longispora albida TaxID=203523 RepID=UPI0012FCE14D|nr:hypothetical protein [Longispora albida]